MKLSTLLGAAILALSALASQAALAAKRVATLDVPGMTCSVCPITVKKALTRVPGVLDAQVSYEAKQAVVTYDDSKTNPKALTQATANAGYPSTVKEVK